MCSVYVFCFALCEYDSVCVCVFVRVRACNGKAKTGSCLPCDHEGDKHHEEFSHPTSLMLNSASPFPCVLSSSHFHDRANTPISLHISLLLHQTSNPLSCLQQQLIKSRFSAVECISASPPILILFLNDLEQLAPGFSGPNLALLQLHVY